MGCLIGSVNGALVSWGKIPPFIATLGTMKICRSVTQQFMQTEAYNKLFMELCTDSKAAAEFFNNIVPQKMLAEAADKAVNPPTLVPVD